MNVELLQNLSVIAFIAGGVFLVLAVALFFILHIPSVVDDLTGAAAKREIEDISKRSYNATQIRHNVTAANRRPRGSPEAAITEKIATNPLHAETVAAPRPMAPQPAPPAQVTTVLPIHGPKQGSNFGTTKDLVHFPALPQEGFGETAVLNVPDLGATTVLPQGQGSIIIAEIELVESNEIIELG